MTVRQAHPSQSWSGTRSALNWSELHKEQPVWRVCVRAHVSIGLTAAHRGGFTLVEFMRADAGRLHVVSGRRRDRSGPATGAEIQTGLFFFLFAYRTTVSIRMSLLLICPRLDVCV